jgi:hypothetical protein
MPLEKAVSSTHMEMLLRVLDIYQLHVGEGEAVHVLRVRGIDLKDRRSNLYNYVTTIGDQILWISSCVLR